MQSIAIVNALYIVQNCGSQSMGEFLCKYSSRKYSSETLQMEFTYNFSAGLDRSQLEEADSLTV